MMKPALSTRRVVSLAARSLLPLLLLEGLNLAVGGALSPAGVLQRWAFCAVVLLAGQWTPILADRLRRPPDLFLVVVLLAALLWLQAHALIAAWAGLALLFVLLLGLNALLETPLPRGWRWVAAGLCAVWAGAVPVALVQIDSRFADEEFFAVVEGGVLGLLWLLLLLLGRWQRQSPNRSSLATPPRPWLLPTLLLAASIVGGVVTLRAYQRSFYPPEAPGYPGITAASPFLCTPGQADTDTYDGAQVFRDLMAQVAANPIIGAPEFGMLALGTGEAEWRARFRETLLEEAAAGRFTHPANSVKWIQWEAGLRAYYTARMQAAYPDLFTAAEQTRLRDWFAAINRRALTVEWVDWMYALAFAKAPEGLYENQENGAGLLALLESDGLAADDLSARNRDYLERNRRGWDARFRNTDDAFVYQFEWLANAYFQALYWGETDPEQQRLSFEWLLLQALPDGSSPSYNHIWQPSLGAVAYLGAGLLDDPRYLWLAGRSLAHAAAHNTPVFAQPGAETQLIGNGRSPAVGSCLLYGDSGLPNQMGPLAPDKLIFRDGWTPDSRYLSLNLRFSGWHRYRATNSLIQLDWRGPLVVEATAGESVAWLPEGRSLLRDKRIGRESLNGLLVARTGLGAVLHRLTGMGSPWAQDPPYYAQVIDFQAGGEMEWSHTRLSDWRGWQHDRWVYVYAEGGPLVVIDRAAGPKNSAAALAWHLATDRESGADPWRTPLREGAHPAEAVLLPLSRQNGAALHTESSGDENVLALRYEQTTGGVLGVASLFLLGEWAGAQVELVNEPAGPTLHIIQGDRALQLAVPQAQPPAQ